MTEQIDSFLVQLRSNSLDLNVINNILEDMLESDDSSLRSYMNYELFMGTKGLLNYL